MRRMPLIAAGALALGAGLATNGPALAQDPPAPPPAEPPAETPPVAAGTTTTTLPLLGAPLTVDVTTDAGGGLLDVSLGSPDDFIATGLRSNKVSFTNEAAGTTVKVSAKFGGERVEARAGALADILGPASWSGDVFDTGVATGVSFEIVDRGDGTPDIVGVAATPAAGIESTVGATQYWAKDGAGAGAVAQVEFASSGQRRVLTVKATAGTNSDGEPSASVRLGLSRVRGAELADGAAVGPHTWTGDVCSGPAQVDYVVGENGEVTDVVATPEAQVWAKGRGAWVAFSRWEGVAIHVAGPPEALEVRVSPWIHCDRTDPTVNTEIAPDADDWEFDGRWNGGKGPFGEGWDGNWRDHKGDEHRDGDWHRDGDDGPDDAKGSAAPTEHEPAGFERGGQDEQRGDRGGDRDHRGERDGRDG